MWAPGSRVLDDRFRLDRVLSPGASSEVYAAEQLSLSRKVALRIFRADLGAQVSARFDEEVRRLATVDHPAVVRVIDSGTSDTTRFLVSELPDGSVLADELKGEPLMPDRALELLTQLADGLAAIHGKGLVHGDLRAGTVLLVKGVSGEQARLADFGLARLIEPKAPEAQATVIGLVVSPEEIAAAAAGQPPGDVFAFGALAYQMLSGVVPARAGARPLAEAAPHLADQAELCALVMRCLETDPARRPASASELAKKFAALPRPADPTIFLETMQRPPPVPGAKSPNAAPPLPSAAVGSAAAGSAAPPPLPPAGAPSGPALGAHVASPGQAPRPLLASVATLIEAPPIAESALAPPRAAPSRRKPMLAIGAAAVIALAVGVAIFVSGSTRREARHLIERRQPVQALEIIGKALRKLDAPSSDLLALKAAALHLTDAHLEEAAVIKSLPSGASEALDPLVLSGLVEDFAKKEDAALRALLQSLPKQKLHPVLEDFAQEPLSARQWGALRYLDLEQAAGSLKVAALYAASLESNDCAARKAAARRLGQLMDDASEAALGRLRDAPREGAEKNCGQDEAQAALQALKKSR